MIGNCPYPHGSREAVNWHEAVLRASIRESNRRWIEQMKEQCHYEHLNYGHNAG